MTTRSSKRGLVAAAALLGLLSPVATSPVPASAAEPATYAVDFVSSPASGIAMNDVGMVAGVRFTLPPGCTPATCAPVSEAVVWSGDAVIPLPGLPGFSSVTVRGINASGWVVGFAGDPTTGGARALVWKPGGGGYAVVDLGVLPGTTSSSATGIDDLGRVVGYSTTLNFPPSGAPFVWTEATGLLDLAAQGFPNESPLAISRGGTVATSGYWYRLGDPSSVAALAPPPPGFSGPGGYPAAINDAGDQVRFQVSTSAEFFPYLFRYDHAGTWQQLWFLPAGHLAPYGIGSITSAGDITATVGGVGLIAYGPDGLAQPLADKLSPAYGGGDVTVGGPINGTGQILAQVIIGRAQRLARLVAAEACASGCIRVASIEMIGKMIGRPPGQCTDTASNLVVATLSATDDAGSALPGAALTGRFLDDYYLNEPVTGTTSRAGTVRFVHKGPACVGAIAILVEDVTAAGSVLDRTTGQLTNSVVPMP
ncbi:MAG: hypothetical protein A3F92_01440 [Candidatus Rokubacteria bacterium RIFCSPLOWO2_12_FULL_71_22]|nr:MAG: hypothetical protein A3F92_01440 [Candidatus Rokubacteria bacterium RIFCSPLOWO2_12_FULL_71_22]